MALFCGETLQYEQIVFCHTLERVLHKHMDLFVQLKVTAVKYGPSSSGSGSD